MSTLTIVIEYDPSKISRTELTDSMNEWHHGIAQGLGLVSDESTGGYEGYDWSYSYPNREGELAR